MSKDRLWKSEKEYIRQKLADFDIERKQKGISTENGSYYQNSWIRVK